MLNELLTLGSPGLHVIQTDINTFHDLRRVLRQRDPNAVIRFVRGRKATTPQALFDELYAALQFPPYCGENWNALAECATDLRIEAPYPHVLMVRDASHLLEAAPAGELGVFLSVLSGVQEAWAEPDVYRKIPALPFHVVLQEGHVDMQPLRERLASAGGVFRELSLPSPRGA